MTWIQRYRLKRFLESSVWVVPLLSVVAAMMLHRFLWWVELRTRWAWLDFSPEGARSVVSAVTSSMLTFTVFAFSILLLAVQIAGAQLSPRVITLAMEDRLLKLALGTFAATFTYSLAVLGRITDVAPQLSMVVVAIGCFASLGVFVYLVDQTAKNLRPAGVIGKVAGMANQVIEAVYPHPLKEADSLSAEQVISASDKPSRTIYYQGGSGMLQALDGPGLAETARRHGCIIRMAPQVGDFITNGEPLFHIYGDGAGLSDRELHQAMVVGVERTLRQDPAFAFRIIVDIASKALSPAINDPSTAVLALDQIHRLLRIVGRRYLGDGTIRDAAGAVRVILPTPNWEDFVSLGMSEIRFFGASSIQVVRRLRAMIENLLSVLPEMRHPALREQLELLDHTVERSYPDPADRANAGIGDCQGVGASRRNQPTADPARGK
ncbi:MAG TPA: DUF2254 domain-containing protein [Phycisphaerae bacterium]|nr:DUF2254 domain-containing protein [Phycisphaerae bacterium]